MAFKNTVNSIGAGRPLAIAIAIGTRNRSQVFDIDSEGY